MNTPSRQSHRYSFDGRVNITVHRAGEKLDFWGRIADVNESGMGATVSGELSQGEFVVLQFSISSSSPFMELRARVCHRRGYYCGFEFLIVSDRMLTPVAVLEGNQYAYRDTLAFDMLPEGWEPVK